MRLNSEHHEIILNFAEKNPQIITNRWVGLGSNQSMKQLWDQLTTQLNSLGYGTLTTNEYKRRLTDWKSKTKSKASEINQSVFKTGGGPASEIKLSNHESRLLTLMGNKSYEGDNVVELGVKNIPILGKNCQTLVRPNQNSQSLIKRRIVSSPLQSPIFPTPVFEPLQLYTEKKSNNQTRSPPKKKTTYNFQEEFSDVEIEVFDEMEVSSEVSKTVDKTDHIEKQEGNSRASYSNQEHNYADILSEESKSMNSQAKPSTSTTRRNKILNLSKDIQNMNNDSLSVLNDINGNLSNINSNLTKIGDNISKLTDAVCLIAEKINF